MASDRATLKVTERDEFGSRTSRRLRRDGMLPGVVYAGGSEARAFQVGAREARIALQHGGALIDLEFDGSNAIPVVVKEQQRHPVRGDLVHLDLHQVDLKQTIQADVSIEFLGTEDAPGVKTDGGVLEHVAHEILVEALPTNIPESIAVDVSGMEIGDTLQLSAIQAPEDVRFVVDDPEEFTIATLSAPRVAEEEPELEEEAELIGEDGEPIEPAEGEDEDDSEGDSSGDSDDE